MRAYAIGKLMRQAKPDEVFDLVTTEDIRALWPEINRYLGRSRAFWTWLLGAHGGRAAAYATQAQKQRQVAAALCELLVRPCIASLQNLKRLLEAGDELAGGLVRAPFVDGGFSPLTLAWQLHRLSIEEEANAAGWGPEQTAELVAFQGRLVEKLLELSLPE